MNFNLNKDATNLKNSFSMASDFLPDLFTKVMLAGIAFLTIFLK